MQTKKSWGPTLLPLIEESYEECKIKPQLVRMVLFLRRFWGDDALRRLDIELLTVGNCDTWGKEAPIFYNKKWSHDTVDGRNPIPNHRLDV